MTWVIQNCIHLRFFHPQKGYIICWIDNQDPEYNKSLQQLNYHLDWPVIIKAQAEAVLDILTEKVLWACLALKRMHFTQEIKHTMLLGWVNVEKLVSDHPHPSPYYWPLLTPLVQISFSTQPSTAIKIKDDSHNFHKENTTHLLTKIIPALQATVYHESCSIKYPRESYQCSPNTVLLTQNKRGMGSQWG